MRACTWTVSRSYEGVTVVDCTACGFRHQYPIISVEEAAEFYGHEYYDDVKPEYEEIVRRDREHFEFWAAEKREIAEALLVDALGATPAEPAVLDIGASFGQFLEHFADRGWRCVGIEPAVGPAAVASKIRGVAVHTALLEEVGTQELGGPFHVVHLGEVMNHLLDPEVTLRRVYEELLVPGGVLVVETSNDFNDLQSAVVKRFDDVPWWIVSDHVSYFDRDSLTRLLQRVGFTVARRGATFPMELFPLLGSNYRSDPEVGKECHARRVAFELGFAEIGQKETLRRLYTALGEAGFGRALVLHAVKPHESDE